MTQHVLFLIKATLQTIIVRLRAFNILEGKRSVQT